MLRPAYRDPPHRIAVIAVIAAISIGAPHRAEAQSCPIPALNDHVCANKGGSIDDYISCYRGLYEQNVIPAFTSIAECSHRKASRGIQDGLESAAARVTGVIKTALATIDDALNDTHGAFATCIADLNTVDAELEPYLADERAAPDLDAYRRANYTPGHMTFFENVLLTARASRAACAASLQAIRKQLMLLSEVQAHHLDYCAVMRQSASYDSVSRIDALAQWTSVDPDIDFTQSLDFGISLNAQCGYYDFDGTGQATIRYATCPTLTTQYSQTLTGMDGALGWLSTNRNTIVPVSGAVAAGIFSFMGYGAASGPLGALVGAGVGLVIAGLEYISLQESLDDLKDLIASEEQKLKDAVASHLITTDQFAQLITDQCTPWKAAVDQRVTDMLAKFDIAKHLQTIEAYYTLSDRLIDWYDELFLWSITPGPDGTRFLDAVAQQDLLAQKDHFDQQVFAARAAQEKAVTENALTNIKGTVTLLACSGLSTSQKFIAKSQLSAGVLGFNRKCADTMSALAVAPDQPVAFADPTVASSVVCRYSGFRNDVSSLEVADGDSFASNLTIRSATGAVIAQIPNVTSISNFAQLPGFACASDQLQAFGTSATTRLAPAIYALHLQDNLLGVQASDASAMRTDIQNLDAQMRFKAIVCARQLGATYDTPRTADACGIPAVR